MGQANGSGTLIGRRYQLGDLLGQGGMGTVYRAADRLTGQTVALKRVMLGENAPASDSDSVNFRLALAREFKVLASLRHPNIISVLDYGFDESRQPFVTMELLDSARNFVEASDDTTLDQRIDLLIQLLQALAYLHRRGILHRDLKPSNVLVDPAGELKVVDFGLALDAEAEKEIAGTLAYMAPELIQGRPPTPSGDLYAVGVMAYELFTGRHPYDITNIQKLMWEVLHGAPDLSTLVDITPGAMVFKTIRADDKPPSDDDLALENMDTAIGLPDDALPPTELTLPPGSVPQDDAITTTTEMIIIPADWDGETSVAAIVGKLLSKTPEARYQQAYDVILDLCRALNRPVPQESSAIRESFLQAAAFVGRETELNTLEAALKAAREGRGSAWLVAGESGVGKSRLVEELRIRAVVQGVTVLRGQGIQGGGVTYQLWREPLRRLALTTPMNELDAGILKELIPDIETLLNRPVMDAPIMEGTAHQQRLFGTITSLFQRQTEPVMLLLEDLHWLGESLEVLNLLNAMAADLPLLIVGNYRHEDRPDLPGDLPGMQVLRLDRLSPQNIAALSASMLGEAGAQPEVIRLLQRETEGNVFFLVEVVRALAEEAGGLDHIRQMDLPRSVLAGGVQAVIRRRLEHVPRRGRDLLRLAAVLGREIDTDVLNQVRGRQKLDDWLTTCVNSAVLEVQDGRYRFAHDKLREATLAAIPENELKVLHRQIARAIEAARGLTPEQAAILAYHWRMAGEPQEEFVHVMQAGDHALQISAFEDGTRHFRRALEILPIVVPDETEQRALSAELLVKLGEVLLYQGDYAEADRRIADGLSRYRELGEQAGTARALNLLGDICWRRGDYAAATHACEESLALYRQVGDRRGVARVLNRQGMVSLEQGDYDAANAQINESLTLANQMDDLFGRSSSINNLGLVALRKGDYPGATRYFEENLTLLQESGERWKVASALHNLGTASGLQGKLEAANDYFERALSMTRQIGDRRGIALALDNLGFVAQLQGQYDKAERYLGESLALATTIGDRRAMANVQLNLGHVAAAQQDRDRAEANYRQAMNAAREIEAVPVMLEALAGLAKVQPEPERALAWIGLAQGHPAASQETRDLAAQVLGELKKTLTPEQVETGLARGAGLELAQVVSEILGTSNE